MWTTGANSAPPRFPSKHRHTAGGIRNIEKSSRRRELFVAGNAAAAAERVPRASLKRRHARPHGLWLRPRLTEVRAWRYARKRCKESALAAHDHRVTRSDAARQAWTLAHSPQYSLDSFRRTPIAPARTIRANHQQAVGNACEELARKIPSWNGVVPCQYRPKRFKHIPSLASRRDSNATTGEDDSPEIRGNGNPGSAPCILARSDVIALDGAGSCRESLRALRSSAPQVRFQGAEPRDRWIR